MPPAGNERPENVYSPGQQVPVSGVYVVIHDGHRPDHSVTLRENEIFPPCTVCTDKVRFRQEQLAQEKSAGAT